MTRPLRAQGISRFAAVLVAAAMLVIAAAWPGYPAAGSDDNSVRLIVDYGDGTSRTISNLAWATGNTILDAMKAATSRPHGISFSFTGTGATAVLTKIDDVQNEGAGSGKKNWQYLVNNVYGDRSFATFELQAQDNVVWRFTTEQGK